MKSISWIFASLLLLLAACSRGSTPLALDTESAPIVVTDALGRTVILPAAPQRIVITGKALIMIADAAYTFSEAPERVVALGKITQGAGNFLALIDPDYAVKAIIEQDASAEQVAALRPDLVILKSYLAETMVQPIEALGIPVIYVDFETPEQYTRDLAILGAIFQDQARAEDVSSYYRERVRKTPVTGLFGSPCGCTFNTSRSARCSQVRIMISCPTRIPCSPSSKAGINSSLAFGAPWV